MVSPATCWPIVGTCESYEDTQTIQSFVRSALDLVGPTLGDLRPDGSPPLVVLKPNWVAPSHHLHPEVWESVITHPELLLAVAAEVADRLDGNGVICICDAPDTGADFAAISARGDLSSRLHSLREKHDGVALELLDLRREVWVYQDGIVVSRRSNPEDPRGYVAVDLGSDSAFRGHPGQGRYYGADYDVAEVNRHHIGDTHEYLLAGTPMQCDLFINLPKLKTHQKAGLTCAMKNLVGINGDKNWLPHYTRGWPACGGDEYRDGRFRFRVESTLRSMTRAAALHGGGLGKAAARLCKRAAIGVLGRSDVVPRTGGWEGNDTIWRMVLDLNRAFLYADGVGGMQNIPQRRYLSIVDGIIAGEGNGPLLPDAVALGVMVAGTNPAHTDAAACRLMGLNPGAVRYLGAAFMDHRWPLSTCVWDALRVWDARCSATVRLDELRLPPKAPCCPPNSWPSLAVED